MKKVLLGLIILMSSVQWGNAQIPIAEARLLPQGTADITIQGIVTNGPELGAIRYIQDETGGLPFFFPDAADDMDTGDMVTITGTMGEFMTLIQLTELTDWEVLSSGNPLPDPVQITASQIGPELEAQLVAITGATFLDGGDVFGFGTWPFIDSSNEESVIFTRTEHQLTGMEIPFAPVDLVGIVGIFGGNYQLLPRTLNDFAVSDTPFISSNLEQSNIQTSSFDLSFTGSEEGLGGVRYGLTEEFELGEIMGTEISSTHMVSLEGLAPAEFYFVQAFVNGDNGVAQSITRVFSTQSESSGAMEVYFNKPVDTSFSTGTEAIFLEAVEYEAVIIDFINAAQSTLDVAVLNNNRPTIINALNDADERGVVVRYLYDDGSFNEALQNQAASFPDFPTNEDALMHNKFMVRDFDSVDDSWILTGSTNWTVNNIRDDPNNIVLIQDQALAKAYTWEFNEMWGSDEASTFPNQLVFGPNKRANTPNNFIVGESPVELYFSPTDKTTNAIVEAINSADHTLEIALLSFTQNDIGNAVRDVNDIATVRGIMESIGDTGSEFEFLVGEGVNLLHHNLEFQLHHKYAIIDADQLDSDPIVITGSHNWSASAENANDENTLIIHNAEIANIYLQEFNNRFCELTSGSCVTGIQTDPSIQWKLYPVPAAESITVELQEPGIWQASLINTLGQRVSTETINGNQHQIDVSTLANGTYLLQLQDGKRTISQTVSILH